MNGEVEVIKYNQEISMSSDTLKGLVKLVECKVYEKR